MHSSHKVLLSALSMLVVVAAVVQAVDANASRTQLDWPRTVASTGEPAPPAVSADLPDTSAIESAATGSYPILWLGLGLLGLVWLVTLLRGTLGPRLRLDRRRD
jgi:hypothetical protein